MKDNSMCVLADAKSTASGGIVEMTKSTTAVVLSLALHGSAFAVFPFTLPSDPGFPLDPTDIGIGKQWYLIQPTAAFPGRINVQAVDANGDAGLGAWKTFGITGSGVTIGVLDHTIEPRNSDFGTSDDNDDGLINEADDFGKFVFLQFPYNNTDAQHGGIIAASIVGIADGEGDAVGIAPDADVIYRETPNLASPSVVKSTVIDSINFFINQGVKISTNSWNDHWNDDSGTDPSDFQISNLAPTEPFSTFSTFLLAYEFSPASLLQIHAAGNTHEPIARTQAIVALDAIMGISNIRQDGVRHFSSSFGRSIELGSPGDKLYLPFYFGESPDFNPGGLRNDGGTSFSAPLVAGVGTLVSSANSNLGPQQIRRILQHTARPYSSHSTNSSYPWLGDLEPLSGHSISTGYGIVDAYNAVEFTVNHTMNNIAFPNPVSNLTASRVRDSVTLNWTNSTEDEFDGITIYRYEGNLWSNRLSEPDRLEHGDLPGVAIAGADHQTSGTMTSYVDSNLSNDTVYTYAVYSYAEDFGPGSTMNFRYGHPQIIVTGNFAEEELLPSSSIAIDRLRISDAVHPVASSEQELNVADTIGALNNNLALHNPLFNIDTDTSGDGIAAFLGIRTITVSEGTPTEHEIFAVESDVVGSGGFAEHIPTDYQYITEFSLTDSDLLAASLSFDELVEMWGNFDDSTSARSNYGTLTAQAFDPVTGLPATDPVTGLPLDMTFLDNHEHMTYSWRKQAFDLTTLIGNDIKVIWNMHVNSEGPAIPKTGAIGSSGSQFFREFGWVIDNVAVAVIRTVAQPCILLGDLNEDGVIDSVDLGILNSNWGTADPDSDLNNDGIVDGLDLGLLLGAWGPCP